MDYLEILDYCAFDVEESSEIVNACTADVIEEVLTEIGLERISTESRG